jgi:hypothetical protein
MNKYGIAIWVNEYPCEDIEYVTNYPQLYSTKDKAQKELSKLINADCEKLNNELKQNDDTTLHYDIRNKNQIIMFNDQHVNLAISKEYTILEFEDE